MPSSYISETQVLKGVMKTTRKLVCEQIQNKLFRVNLKHGFSSPAVYKSMTQATPWNKLEERFQLVKSKKKT